MTQPPTPTPRRAMPDAPGGPATINWSNCPTTPASGPQQQMRITRVGIECGDCGAKYAEQYVARPSQSVTVNIGRGLCPVCTLKKRVAADLARYNQLPFWRRMITRRPGRDR